MKSTQLALCATIFFVTGCTGEPDLADPQKETASQSATAIIPTQFDGVWEVFGRTGNEDGTNEPVCGYETAVGMATIDGSRITGDITNKSGFEYTVEGTIDNNGIIKAMLIYSGYDAAELFGTFSAETNTAKGNWEDAVNACPGIWKATRVSATTRAPVHTGKPSKNTQPDKEQAAKSG